MIEINSLLRSYSNGQIDSEQMIPWLKNVYRQGMTDQEIIVMVEAMIDSGDSLDFSYLGKKIVDKHSTGGVGDKVSLVLSPILASCGVAVPMIAGRSLGHTGGTIDKLESIPGYKVDISLAEFRKNVENIGVSIIGQTAQICPADKKLYALRDKTNMIDSIPLICGSIMCKKIAEGIDTLVINIPLGNGAFMKTLEDGKLLEEKLVFIGEKFGIQTSIVFSNMDQPLGREAGLWNEIQESVACLRGHGDQDLMTVVKALAKPLLENAGHKNWAEKFRVVIDSGSALQKFEEMVEAHNGDASLLNSDNNIYWPRYKTAIKADKSGFVKQMHTERIGWAVNRLTVLTEGLKRKIDPSGGVRFEKKLGDQIQKGETLAVCCGKNQSQVETAAKNIFKSIKIGKFALKPEPIII